MYVAATSDKQQSDSLRPAHKKSLQTQNGFRGENVAHILFGRDNTAHQKTPFFLFGGLVLPMVYKSRADKL